MSDILNISVHLPMHSEHNQNVVGKPRVVSEKSLVQSAHAWNESLEMFRILKADYIGKLQHVVLPCLMWVLPLGIIINQCFECSGHRLSHLCARAKFTGNHRRHLDAPNFVSFGWQACLPDPHIPHISRTAAEQCAVLWWRHFRDIKNPTLAPKVPRSASHTHSDQHDHMWCIGQEA
eukprot:1974576-Amphidinium_carterae.1